MIDCSYSIIIPCKSMEIAFSTIIQLCCVLLRSFLAHCKELEMLLQMIYRLFMYKAAQELRKLHNVKNAIYF